LDDPEGNPGIDLPHIVALPTYAASALVPPQVARPRILPLRSNLSSKKWKKSSPRTTMLRARWRQEERTLPKAERQAIAEKLHGLHRPSRQLYSQANFAQSTAG